MAIMLISFDADDTLYDFTTLSTRALEETAYIVRVTLGIPPGDLSALALIADLETVAEQMEHPYARIPELRRRAFARTLMRFGKEDPALVERMNKTYEEFRFQPVVPYDGARQILLSLSRRCTLCTISNGEQNLEALGLQGVFDFTVTAADVGFQKPDARIFEAAMRRAGCAPSEMAHIGDSLRSDVAGALAAGAWAIWFNPAARENTRGIQPHREIRSLDELSGVLESLR